MEYYNVKDISCR